jgi:hypothetical protein
VDVKFWNKQHRTRKRHWTIVQRTQFAGAYDIKISLMNDGNKGKFYYDPNLNIWWFEKVEDAIIFKLKWQNI